MKRSEGWVDMVLPVRAEWSAVAGTTLRDFEIRSAAEVGQCRGGQSFRAVCRRDGSPVLLHKFRPADSLLDLGPVIDEPEVETPGFSRAFVTRFTAVFAAAGSVYLVEPLPACVGLFDIWRYVLLNRPHQALIVAGILTRQLHSLVRRLAGQGDRHGAMVVENIVLTRGGSFGVLAASVQCERGRLWLRKDPREPVLCDVLSPAGVLRSLLDIEEELACLRCAPGLLSPAVHDGILDLARRCEQARPRIRM